MSKSSKRRAFHISTKLLTAGALVGGVALGAGCKSDQTSNTNTGGPKDGECCVNPGPVDPPKVDPPVVAAPDMEVTQPPPVSPPINVNPGPVKVSVDMGAVEPAQKDMEQEDIAKPSTLKPVKLDEVLDRPNVNTRPIRRPSDTLIKKP